MVNPYKGVDLASKPSVRHYVRNLYCQPLRRGISVDKCFDVGRIENVHFGPFSKYIAKRIRAAIAQEGLRASLATTRAGLAASG